MRHCGEAGIAVKRPIGRPLGLLAMAILFVAPAFAKARRPEPGTSQDVYSISKAQPVPIASRKTQLPLVVYGEDAGSKGTYVPSGYMGDTGSLRIKGTDFSAPLTSTKTGTTCLRVDVLPKGREGWVGLYWQTPANNWGKVKGAGYDLSGAESLTFWARGENGGEKISQFGMGGLVGPYPDTDAASIGPIRLTKDWSLYTIDLKGKDLRHIAGGFSFIAKRADNPRGAVFYVDEIVYRKGAEVVASTPTVEVIPTPEPVPTATPAPRLPKTVKIVVPFASAKRAFLEEGRDAMDEVAGVALKYPTSHLIIEGHTDNIGSASLNKRLSYERARSVADYLASKGIASDRMDIAGYGEERPVREGSNDTEAGRRENRRVEVTLQP